MRNAIFWPVIAQVLLVLAAAPAGAADEPAKKSEGSNKVERAVEKAGAAVGKTLDKAEKKVKQGAAATERGIESVGQKTGAAVGKTVDKVGKKVEKGAKATGKAIENAGDKTDRWIKEKTN